MLAVGRYALDLATPELQTFAFVTLVFGSQGLLYVLRERRRLWSSMPSRWVVASCCADIAVLAALTVCNQRQSTLRKL